ncbi:hypothetical protein HanIR_Chr04g0176631 [Helianthus annuus]|nr:hypothetical protein HanIR_Chr04g0176631 [Helianthus annuus]
MILLHELTKICLFSITDVGELIFKISKAKHDEQMVWLIGLKCLR